MRNVVRNEDMGDNNYDNEITRSIDSQDVIAPQYGYVVKHPQLDPTPTSPGTSNTRYKRNAKRGFRYNVRSIRTKPLKVAMDILRAELALVDSGQQSFHPRVVAAMRSRLALMSTEKARRDLRDLVGGKMQSRGSFYSLGARARAA